MYSVGVDEIIPGGAEEDLKQQYKLNYSNGHQDKMLFQKGGNKVYQVGSQGSSTTRMLFGFKNFVLELLKCELFSQTE